MINGTLARIGRALYILGTDGEFIMDNSFEFSIEKTKEALKSLGIDYSVEEYEECVKFIYKGVL